jgi:hypothetical protein
LVNVSSVILLLDAGVTPPYFTESSFFHVGSMANVTPFLVAVELRFAVEADPVVVVLDSHPQNVSTSSKSVATRNARVACLESRRIGLM